MLFMPYSDDHALFKWNLVTGEATKVCELPPDIYPTDLNCFSKSQSGGKRHGQEQFLITSTDGKLSFTTSYLFQLSF